MKTGSWDDCVFRKSGLEVTKNGLVAKMSWSSVVLQAGQVVGEGGGGRERVTMSVMVMEKRLLTDVPLHVWCGENGLQACRRSSKLPVNYHFKGEVFTRLIFLEHSPWTKKDGQPLFFFFLRNLLVYLQKDGQPLFLTNLLLYLQRDGQPLFLRHLLAYLQKDGQPLFLRNSFVYLYSGVSKRLKVHSPCYMIHEFQNLPAGVTCRKLQFHNYNEKYINSKI